MNVVLLVTDTYRYDNLYPVPGLPMAVRAPNLARFAGQAASMSRFYTGSFPTIPQRTDLATGRLGWPWFGWRGLPEPWKDNRLARILREAGYGTQLICDCPHLFRANFHHAFHGALQLRGQEGDVYLTRYNYPIERAMPREKTRVDSWVGDGPTLADTHRWQHRFWRLERDTFPPRTAETAVEWLEENYKADRFFLWVDFFDPHEPWDPPEYMVRRYDPGYTGTPMIHPNYGPSSDYTEAELRNLRAHYCAEAELVDRWIGRVLEKIDDLGLWGNSIVIVTTDHGISIGEHARCGKSNIHRSDPRHWPMYPEIAHIPFLIAAPGIGRGITLDCFAQPVDILPTVLELAGLRADTDRPLHGRSFAAALRGERGGAGRDCAVTGSYMWTSDGSIHPRACTPVLYTDKWAYVPVGAGGCAELYDLVSDPLGERNLAPGEEALVRELHSRFLGWLREHEVPDPVLRSVEAIRAPELR